jgi:hypothetical protein
LEPKYIKKKTFGSSKEAPKEGYDTEA